MFLRRRTKLLVAHHAVEDFVVTFHPLYKQVIENAPKEGGKIGLIVRVRRLDDLLVTLSRDADLIEEELIGLGEVRSEPFVELFDQC